MFTFKGYSLEELKNSNNKKVIAKYLGEYVEGEIMVQGENIIFLSNCSNFCQDLSIAKDTSYSYNWFIYIGDSSFEASVYNSEKNFEIFSIIKEDIKEKWGLVVKYDCDKFVNICTTLGTLLCQISEKGVVLFKNADPHLHNFKYEKIEGMFDNDGRLKVVNSPHKNILTWK